MLILQRKAGESLLIGEEIEISVLSVEAGRVRLAIEAPRNVSILRREDRNLDLLANEQGFPRLALENQHAASSFPLLSSAREWRMW